MAKAKIYAVHFGDAHKHFSGSETLCGACMQSVVVDVLDFATNRVEVRLATPANPRTVEGLFCQGCGIYEGDEVCHGS